MKQKRRERQDEGVLINWPPLVKGNSLFYLIGTSSTMPTKKMLLTIICLVEWGRISVRSHLLSVSVWPTGLEHPQTFSLGVPTSVPSGVIPWQEGGGQCMLEARRCQVPAMWGWGWVQLSWSSQCWLARTRTSGPKHCGLWGPEEKPLYPPESEFQNQKPKRNLKDMFPINKLKQRV